MRSLACIALAAIALPAAAAAATITRGPFLQQTGPTSTLVVVDTDQAATVDVAADLPGGGEATGRSAGTAHHVVQLTGLVPGSAIAYRVAVDGTPGPAATFRTPGVPGTEAARHAVIGVVGDEGSGGTNARANVAAMKARGVHAIFTTGDNAMVQPPPPAGDTPQQWNERFFDPYAPLLPSAPVFPVPGDHEYLTPWAAGYTGAFELPNGERFYSFDWGDLHVAALDSNCISPIDAATAGCTTATITAWLEADLAATKAFWKVALLHRPAVAAGHYGVYPQIPAALVPIFQKHGVDLVLQAHNHLWERSWPTRDGQPTAKDYDRPDAPVYVTTGGAGDWIYACDQAPGPWTARCISAFHHTVLTLDGGKLKVEAIRPDGSFLDGFEIVKDVPPPVVDPVPGGSGGDGGAGGEPGSGADAGGNPPGAPRVRSGCSSGGGTGLAAVVAMLAAAGAWRGRARRRR